MMRSRVSLSAAAVALALGLALRPDTRRPGVRWPVTGPGPPDGTLARRVTPSLFRGRPVGYWREKVKRGQFRCGGWMGTLSVTNDPPVWPPGPSWPQALVGLAVVRSVWKAETVLPASEQENQEVVPLLLELIRDENPLVRKVAAQGLGPYCGDRWRSLVVPALERAMRDRYGDIREWAARSLLIVPGVKPELKRAAEEVRGSGRVPQVFSTSMPLTGWWLDELARAEPLPEWLEHVASLTATGDAVAGAGLVHLARLPRLEHLDLSGTDLTDEGVGHLGRLTGLVSLDLSSTGVTDAGIAALNGLPQLRRLELSGTAVSEAAVRGLRRTRPCLEVVR
jgi:HEAT repeats/Leucine Rich repeat